MVHNLIKKFRSWQNPKITTRFVRLHIMNTFLPPKSYVDKIPNLNLFASFLALNNESSTLFSLRIQMTYYIWLYISPGLDLLYLTVNFAWFGPILSECKFRLVWTFSKVVLSRFLLEPNNTPYVQRVCPFLGWEQGIVG